MSLPIEIHHSKQQGMVLVISLVFLLTLTIVGGMSMQNTVLDERITGNARQRVVAFQMAEAALSAGEDAVTFTPASSTGYYRTPTAPTNSAYSAPLTQTNTNVADYWRNFNWDDSNSRVITAIDTSPGAPASPRYVIELMNQVTTGSGGGGGGSLEAGKPLGQTGAITNPQYRYRITARGVGNVSDAVTIVQSVFIQ
ncbi:hypothetical protein TI05_08500 [Achromatium sp. WMS3]|nr:hypothetical protein TI05_08500 [Achromatium sp. WMS3]